MLILQKYCYLCLSMQRGCTLEKVICILVGYSIFRGIQFDLTVKRPEEHHEISWTGQAAWPSARLRSK